MEQMSYFRLKCDKVHAHWANLKYSAGDLSEVRELSLSLSPIKYDFVGLIRCSLCQEDEIAQSLERIIHFMHDGPGITASDRKPLAATQSFFSFSKAIP